MTKRDTDLKIRLRMWRQSLGLTQLEFARRAGLSKATLVGYEVGQRQPGTNALAAIARTGVNMTWLLTGEGEMLARPAKPELHVLEGKGERRSADEDVARLLRQIEAILLSDPDQERRRETARQLYARAQEQARIAELEQALAELKAARSARRSSKRSGYA